MRYQYNCVSPASLEELEYIIDNGEEITLQEFSYAVNSNDFESLATELGYSKDFPLSEDWHLIYNRSIKEDGETVYYMVHSAIEYVFYN